MRWLFSFLALAFVGFVQALSSSGNRLLVVIDELGDKNKYSKFWGDLESRGYSISFDTPKSTTLSLFKHGLIAYEHLLILPSKSKGLGPNLTPNLLVDYANGNGNIMLALSGEGATPSSISSLLLEFDINLPTERNSVVVDHFNYDKSSAGEKHDVLLVAAPRSVRSDTEDYFAVGGTLAVPRAVGQTLGNANPLIAPILRAPATAYSYNPKEEAEGLEDIFAAGSQLSLVTAFQARNSARLTVLGSVEMLEDKWFGAKVQDNTGKDVATSNKAFAEKLSQWTFQEIGVLKVGRIQHHLNEGAVTTGKNLSVSESPETNPTIYRVKNDVAYMIELSEWKVDHWAPFDLPSGDAIQLEFSMLSPFHRLALQATSRTASSTIYSTSFKTPDQHGIFNFLVNYKRPFLTNVYEKSTVTVRHFAHDEWPRSYVITAAYPWVGGIGVTVAGFLLFVLIWLFSQPTERNTIKKTQ